MQKQDDVVMQAIVAELRAIRGMLEKQQKPNGTKNSKRGGNKHWQDALH